MNIVVVGSSSINPELKSKIENYKVNFLSINSNDENLKNMDVKLVFLDNL